MKLAKTLTDTLCRPALLATAAMVTALGSLQVKADDTELFIGKTLPVTQTRPNILFILDTSGSMDTNVETNLPWNPDTTWDGPCNTTAVYFRGGTGDPPQCAADNFINESSWACQTGTASLDTAGFYTSQFAMHRPDTTADVDDGSTWGWRRLITGQQDRTVECSADIGVHGGGDDRYLYPINGYENYPWWNIPNNPAWNTYTAYTGNYLNWYYHSGKATQTRLDIMKSVMDSVLDSITDVNVGAMRFSKNNDDVRGGGMVMVEMGPVEDQRERMKQEVNSWDHDGWTPLSETLYEAHQYYSGGDVAYGLTSVGKNVGEAEKAMPSIVASRNPANLGSYLSPLEESCQKSFIVLLTDGLPTRDTGANGRITSLPGYAENVGVGCDDEGITDGRCLDDLAEYMFEADLAADLPGTQNVTTYTIGFDVSHPVLVQAAQRGGGEFFFANDTSTLATALTNIVTEILDDTVTFTAPAVSVNAFNRTQNLNEVYITTFQASETAQWPGNLKKYRVVGGELTGQDGNTVVDDTTGFFKDNAWSYWSASTDGASVTQGGAAAMLPDPDTRNVYTDVSGGTLTAQGNAFAVDNAAITRAMLGIENRPEVSRDDVINFARGADSMDEDQDGDKTDPRQRMGDPLHSKPAILIYGGTPASPDLSDAMVYFADNEGFLHAVDPATGRTAWSYLPQETMVNMVDYMENEDRGDKIYGLDGNLRAVRIDKNDNGIIEPGAGDSVTLYFGQRRGGDTIFAVDVTRKDSPVLKWKIDSNTLPGVGQTWSTPVPARVDIGGTERSVLVVGGGYDTSQDVTLYSRDFVGRAIYMLDAETGALLWWAGGSNSGADLEDFNFDNSIPADVRVLDMSGDGRADRMYAADTGGQIWRFDIKNGNNRANLVDGGVIASLGAADMGTPTTASSRRFYYAPDVAIVQKTETNQKFINIAIGSGYRASPNNVFIQDRFYSVRDYDVFNQLSGTDYAQRPVITEGDLVDITADLTPTIPDGAKGWYMELRDPTFRGEKVLAEARQFQNQVLFTTFTPGGGAGNSCSPAAGLNRLYVVSAVDGSPTNNLDQSEDPDVLTLRDRYQELEQGGISPEVVFIFPSPDDPENCVGDECTPPPVCLVGLESCQATFDNAPVRTFWTQDGAE